jgi:glycosyltransferase involved in cell wall biosynthesis
MNNSSHRHSDVRVSIIVPAYNAEATLAETLDSALAQDFRSFEVIVANDGSTDGTMRVLESYRCKIRVISQPNRGVSAARNRGAAEAQGDYLAFLDSDDRWRVDKLSRTVSALDNKKGAVLAFSDVLRVNSEGECHQYVFGSAPSMEDLLKHRAQILPSAAVMRSSVFNLCGGFSEEFHHPGFEDPYMWTVAREHGEFVYVPELLVTYRLNQKSHSSWYLSNGELFIRLVRRRYGKRASLLIRETYDHLARVALQDALERMDCGDHLGALERLARTLRFKPQLLFERQLLSRFFRTRNLQRFRNVFPRGKSRLGSDDPRRR